MRKIGWTADEDAILKDLTERAQGGGGSLSAAFRAAADATGRKPDSVRNHYYALTRGKLPKNRCVPFTDEETAKLLDGMNRLIGSGCSVRKAALELAGGDDALMLRYQNKYRSILGKKREKKTKALSSTEAPCTGEKELARIIREKNTELALQHERYVLLHSMFEKLCEINRELARQLAGETERKSAGKQKKPV